MVSEAGARVMKTRTHIGSADKGIHLRLHPPHLLLRLSSSEADEL